MTAYFWVKRAKDMQDEAQAHKDKADEKPSISVADLMRFTGKVISYKGELYQITVRKVGITK